MSEHLYFSELYVKDTFVKEIQSIFESENIVNELGFSVMVYSEFDDKVSNLVLPCILVSINDVSTNTSASSFDNTQYATDFTIECDVYSRDMTDYSRETAVLSIGDVLNHTLTGKYKNFRVSSVPLPNIDTNIARRLYRFMGTLDNKHNYLY